MSKQRETEFDNLELIDPEIRQRVADWYARCIVRIERERRQKEAASREQATA